MRQQQWGALALFAHLASRVPAALEASSSVVLTHAMIHCANSPDALVRVQLADLVMALAPLGYFTRSKEVRNHLLMNLSGYACGGYPHSMLL